MKFESLTLLADENFDQQVASILRARGWDVASLESHGMTDSAVLAAAHDAGRVVPTHDADFGALAIAARQPLIGIAYFRPGHIRSEFTLASVDAVVAAGRDLVPPFVLVAQRRGDSVSIRVRAPIG